MKPTVLDRLVERLQVWPENTDYIAGHQGWLWRYQTKSGVSGGILRPAIEAPYTDPTGSVTETEWRRARMLAGKVTTSVVSWDGEGLPPVGAAIEYSTSRTHGFKRVWHKAVVKYVSKSNFVFTDDEGLECVIDAAESDIQYRPVMTAEERYEHRKAKAVKAMMDIYDAPASEGLTREGVLEIIFAAIAAGDIPGVLAIKDDE